MRTGKLPEHTFKRSVINPIRYRRSDTEFRMAVGHDGAVFGQTAVHALRGSDCTIDSANPAERFWESLPERVKAP